MDMEIKGMYAEFNNGNIRTVIPTADKTDHLQIRIEALEKQVAVLEARPICYGHVCGWNHYNYPQYPNNPPTITGTSY